MILLECPIRYGWELAETNFNLSDEFGLLDTFGVEAYFGTDAIELTPYVGGSKDYTNVRLTQEIGLKIRPFDEVVSAPPISATNRDHTIYRSRLRI